jgi:hypothetical protein
MCAERQVNQVVVYQGCGSFSDVHVHCTHGLPQVRAHMVLQAGAAGGTSPSKAAAKRATAAAAAARQRHSLSLAVVLERARSRLQVGCKRCAASVLE